jgi:hypothetical protein
VNAGADQSVVVPGPASLAGSAADDGLPNPPAAVTTAWSVVSGPGTVTFGNAAQASTSASFSAAGTYVLRLTASDGALTSSDDVTVTVSPAGSGGSLSVSGAAPPAGVNLSAEGTADWAHWGLTSPSSFDHKAAVTPQISNYTTLGGGSALQYSNSPIAYTWSGGTPTSAATGTPTGVWVFGTGAGFQVTVPADASQRTLKVYAGVWSAGGKFEATLSDASAPAYTDTSLVNQTGASDRVYTVAYRAASPGQTLTVRWTANSTYNTYGNVTLQGATLF